MQGSHPAGYPIRLSGDQRMFAPPPGFSQLTTAFFASQLPGIRHKPVLRLTILLFLLRHTYVCLLFPFPSPVKYRLPRPPSGKRGLYGDKGIRTPDPRLAKPML